MKRSYWIPALAGLVLVAGLAATAVAQDDRIVVRDVRRSAGAPDGMRRGHGAKFADLDLSDDQRTKIEAVFDKQRRDAIKLRADLELAQLDMRKLMRADSPNRSAINALIDKTATTRTALRKAQVGAMLDMRAVLTPEQQKKLRESRGSGSMMQGRRMLDGPMGPGGDDRMGPWGSADDDDRPDEDDAL